MFKYTIIYTVCLKSIIQITYNKITHNDIVVQIHLNILFGRLLYFCFNRNKFCSLLFNISTKLNKFNILETVINKKYKDNFAYYFSKILIQNSYNTEVAI